MKQLLILLVLLPFLSSAQNTFAPLGAEWRYEGPSEWNSTILDCAGNNLRYIVEDELTIDNKNCTLIRAYHSTNLDTSWRSRDSLIVWQDEKKIYFLQDSSFLLLFDFGAELGDTIIRYDPYRTVSFSGTQYDDSTTTANRMELIIAEVDSIIVDGDYRKIQHLVPTDPNSGYSGDSVMENIGSMSQNICGDYFYYVANGCDGSGFLCYADSTIAFPEQGCDFTDSVATIPLVDFSIYPNPFDSFIQIDINNSSYTLSLSDINGKTIIQQKNKSHLATENILPGIYLLQIRTHNKIYSKKVIKI